LAFLEDRTIGAARRESEEAPAGSAVNTSLLSSASAMHKTATRRKLRRSRLRILRLLEVTETRRASGVAWNAGNRQVHARLEALASEANWDVNVQTLMQT